MTHAEATVLFDRRRLAWLAADLDAYLACWADDMSFQSPTQAEPLRGRAAFADLVRRSLALARPVRFDVLALAVDGRVVLAEWVIAVERRSDGRRVEWHGMSVAEFDGGLIRRWREYWNPADLTGGAPAATA